jgi:hypothetical protein
VSSLLQGAKALVLLALVSVGLGAMLSSNSLQAALALGALNALLAALYGWALVRDRQTEFSLGAGASLVLNTSAIVLLAGEGLAAPWAAFGVGLVALMSGNHTCRSADVLEVKRHDGAGTEEVFYVAARRGYLRILLFVGLVMLVSLFLLLLSLNAQLGAMPSWAFAALALAAMVALAILARVRHSEE